MTRRDASWAVAGAIGAIVCQMLIGFVIGFAPYVRPIVQFYDAKREGDKLAAEVRPLLLEFEANRQRINEIVDRCRPDDVSREQLQDMFVHSYDLAMVRGEVLAYGSILDRVTFVVTPEHLAEVIRRTRESMVKQRDLSAAAIPYIEAVCG